MTRQQFETGIQRLYYVAWVIFAITYSGAVYAKFGPGEYYALGELKLFALVMGIWLVPLAPMLAIRWIYRGFMPKPATE